MSLIRLSKGGLALLVLAGLMAPVAHVQAEGLSLEERRAERAAERAARAAEREAARAERAAEREARRAAREADDVEPEEAPCGCRARLGFSKPDLGFRNGVLTFTPRVDVSVRTRGDHTMPDWGVNLVYGGKASFASDDVTPPGDVFYGSERQIVGGQCGDHRYSFEGLALEPVTLGGLVRGLLSGDELLEGSVEMAALIEGCESDRVYERFMFDFEAFGMFDPGRWRRVRS